MAMAIEIRIYKVDCNHKVADYIVLGITTYLKRRGWSFREVELRSEELDNIVKNNIDIRGRVNISVLMEELNKEKVDISEGLSKDSPHWDVIILGFPISGGYAVHGGLEKATHDPVLSQHLIFTTHLGSDAEIKGALLGFHETHHVFESEHCNNEFCVFSAGELSGRKLNRMVRYWKTIEQKGDFPFPLCAKHSRLFA